jgi:NTP pyrophosphatase (non-canonical NTP hydrolase)
MSPAHAQAPAISLTDYFTRASATDRFASDGDGLRKLLFGFFGEVGGLLAALKKVARDQLRESETEVAGEEVGDALWYLVAAAHTLDISANDLGSACMQALRQELGEVERASTAATTFRNIDGIVDVHSAGLDARRGDLLGELARASGDLLKPPAGALAALTKPELFAQFGHLMATLALVAGSFNLKLEDLARDNLAKISARWPGNPPIYVSLFDEDYAEHEQLPRELRMEFIERGHGKHAHVVQRMNGVFIGDRLTDNSVEPDDYRFHDVFHLAYIAHLGWSPVIRALLKRKRKSDAATDENQDGARAMIIEEGIATWIFNHAKKRDFYQDVAINKLDYGLLKQVESMVAGFEVHDCPPWQWERAILEGFEIFREIRKPEHRGGTVIVNMVEHTIKFERSPA